MKRKFLVVLLTVANLAAFSQQIVPNGSFELWDSTEVLGTMVYNPSAWYSYNRMMIETGETFQPIERTTDAHSGNYAVKIASKSGTQLDMPGILFSTEVSDPEKSGSFPIAGKIDKVEGYYKYIPDVNDSATIVVMFYKDGQKIGSAYHVIKQASSIYQKFLLELQYSTGAPDPDAAAVYVFAGGPANNASSSVLYLDDLAFTYVGSTGLINQHLINKLHVYPNPADNLIFFRNEEKEKITNILITNFQGKNLEVDYVDNDKLEITFLPSGVYTLTITNEKGDVSIARFIKK